MDYILYKISTFLRVSFLFHIIYFLLLISTAYSRTDKLTMLVEGKAAYEKIILICDRFTSKKLYVWDFWKLMYIGLCQLTTEFVVKPFIKQKSHLFKIFPLDSYPIVFDWETPRVLVSYVKWMVSLQPILIDYLGYAEHWGIWLLDY